MTIKLLMQEVGQAANNVALSGANQSTVVKATAGAKFSIDSQPGDIASMMRNGDKLIIKGTDGQLIELDDFFGPASKDMNSLTIKDGTAAEPKYVLGDEKLYADNHSVVPYSAEHLREVVSGQEYYAQQAGEAGATGGEAATTADGEVDPWMVALGIAGVGLVAGGIALLLNDDDNNDSKQNSGGGGNDGDNSGGSGDTSGKASAISLNESNGSALQGTTDTANAKVFVDVNGDGKADFQITSDANGKWSIPMDNHLADKQVVNAWVENSKGEKISTSITVDYHAPDITSMSVDSDLTGLSGITEANATVTLDINGDGVADKSVKADAQGRYSFDLQDAQIIPGTSTLTVTDTVGNESSLTLPKNTGPTILGVSETADGQILLTDTTTLTSPVVRGIGVPGTEVKVLNNGELVATTTVAENGQWQVALKDLPTGSRALTVEGATAIHVNSSTDSAGSTVTVNYSNNSTLNVVNTESQVHTVATDNGVNTTQTLTRALPDGGYLIAWAQPETAGSAYYDIKVNIFNANGEVVNTLTLGQQNTMDGYTTIDGLSGLNNFDVAVSPVDGAITVYYVQGTSGDLDYTGTTAVYQRFSADGTEITSGPQVVAANNELGGLGGMLDAVVGQDLSAFITGTIDKIWDPIEALLQPIASLINVDLNSLSDLFVNGLSNRLASALYGSGTFGANVVQMDDGSVVFVGSRYSECLDSATLVDRLDVSGFITDFFKSIGLIGQGNFVSSLVEPIFNSVMGLVVEPIEGIVDEVLEWVDVNLGSDGSLVWSIAFAPDANGNLVQTTDFEYSQGRNLLSGLKENGFISGSDQDGVINKFAEWVFGTAGDSTSSMLGLDGVQVSNSTYAIVWQQAGTTDEISATRQPKINITLVDAKTGEHITSDTVLSASGVTPKIVKLADGTLLATWVAVDNKDSGDIYALRLGVANNQLVALSAPVLVNTLTEGTQGIQVGTFNEAYDVIALSNGGYVVTWTSTATDGTQHLEAQLFDMSGIKVGTEFQLDAGTGNHINDSSITALSDGGFVVNWSETNSTASSSSVMYSVFNNDGSIRTHGEENNSTDGELSRLVPTTTTYTGTNGNDVTDAQNAPATINAQGGDDRIIVNSGTIVSVDGGQGHDTVVIGNAGAVGSDVLAKLHNIETLDLNSSNGSNTLTLTYGDVIKVTGSDKLFITGGSNDSVDIDQNKWSMTATGNKDGQSYNLYTYDDDHHTQLWIQNGVQVV